MAWLSSPESPSTAEGTLWVTEADASPKRVSAWDAKTGKFVREFFGSTAYGALGGAINPLDPCLMVGHGCEWRIDPATGRAACLGCFVRSGMSNSRFGIGSNGRLYLAVASGWAYDASDVKIFERVGDVDYKLRSSFEYQGKDDKDKTDALLGRRERRRPEAAQRSDHPRRPRAVQRLVHELRARSDDLRRRPAIQGRRLHALRGPEIRPEESDADAGPSAWARPTAAACWPSANTAYRKAGFTASTSPAAKSSGAIRTTLSACMARTRPARRWWA